MQGLCRVKIVPKAFSAKDEDLEEGVMWEQIPGGSSVKVSMSSGK